jgi:KUP system potassium uptake protein
VLAVTGAEAIYADMGHFGRAPIRRAWMLIAFPALTLNYLGQGALLIEDPRGAENPFYLLLPHWARCRWSSWRPRRPSSPRRRSSPARSRSRARRSARLPAAPAHPAHLPHEGQIYVPIVNWTLMAAVLVLVLAFERSENLAPPTASPSPARSRSRACCSSSVRRAQLGRLPWYLAVVAVFLLVVDLAFLGANLTKS